MKQNMRVRVTMSPKYMEALRARAKDEGLYLSEAARDVIALGLAVCKAVKAGSRMYMTDANGEQREWILGVLGD